MRRRGGWGARPRLLPRRPHTLLTLVHHEVVVQQQRPMLVRPLGGHPVWGGVCVFSWALRPAKKEKGE